MSRPREERQRDLFRPALEAIIDLKHPLVRLGERIDWGFVERQLGGVYKPGSGQPPLPIRLMAGLLILKHMHNLSDEALCARWLENPYFQYFCGEQAFRHKLPFDRTSLTRWRQRLGEERLAALLQESLRVAHDTGALEAKDLERVAVDTTVQPKNIAHPTDARLTHKAIIKLVDFAKKNDISLRQSYLRVAKQAAIMVGRYIHARQFKRAARRLKFLRVRLGRLLNDINRKISAHPDAETLNQSFEPLRQIAVKVYAQRQKQRGQKVFALTRRRSNASVKARPAPLMNSAARCRSPYPSPDRKAGNSYCTPKRYTGIPSMGIPSSRQWTTLKRTPASRSAASMSTEAIAAMTSLTSSASGFPARSEEPPPPSNER